MRTARLESFARRCLWFTHISMHIILLAATGLGVEDIDELGEVLEVLGHLSGEDHVNDVVAHLLVRVAVHVLEDVDPVVV